MVCPSKPHVKLQWTARNPHLSREGPSERNLPTWQLVVKLFFAAYRQYGDVRFLGRVSEPRLLAYRVRRQRSRRFHSASSGFATRQLVKTFFPSPVSDNSRRLSNIIFRKGLQTHSPRERSGRSGTPLAFEREVEGRGRPSRQGSWEEGS